MTPGKTIALTRWTFVGKVMSLPFNMLFRASSMAQLVKNLPEMQETQVWSLGGEDPLEKEMATHSSILAWKIPWTEELGRLLSIRLHKVRHNWSDLVCMHTLRVYESCSVVSDSFQSHGWYSDFIHSLRLVIAFLPRSKHLILLCESKIIFKKFNT